MTHDQYAEHVKTFTEEMRAVTSTKNADYSSGENDAMSNYYQLSQAAGITPVQAWMCLMYKHITAIRRFVKTGSVSSETIHGRFVDLANYALLGDALVKDLTTKGLIDENIGVHEEEV